MVDFEFEGERRTISEIRALVPILSAANIRRHLTAGRNTRVAMLTFNVSAARAAAGRKGRAAAERSGAFRNSLKVTA